MNRYRLEDLVEGQTEQFTVTVTEEMQEQFFRMTGDSNPLHRDGAFAAAQGYSDRVVYGMLTASLISTMAGVYLPGEYCLLMEVLSKFSHPVFPGDILTVSGQVAEIDRVFQTIDVKTRIMNGQGVSVYRGRYRAGFLKQE
ncbi:MAG: MaoC family dehydratase N-terminal domain-containing protein [Lachnospiraceae bacterium]|nr:MaoC family dehydratase N-terminal domain-containing protein [Lachnospiraceae bacterium]